MRAVTCAALVGVAVAGVLFAVLMVRVARNELRTPELTPERLLRLLP